MSRSKRTSLSTARLVALPLVSFAASVAPEPPARAAPPALSGTAKDRPARQAPLTLRFAALDRISGEDPDLPAKLLERYPGETVKVVYQVCVRSDGTVMSASRRSGVADADVDAVLLRTLRTWRYPEQPANTMTCLLEIFEFSR